MKKLLNKYKNLNLGIKSSFWFLICSLCQKGISFITIPIFTRLMSAEEYGAYSIFLSWESIISVFATLNLSYQVFNNGMIKYNKKKESYTSSMVGLTFLSCLICLFILLLFNKSFLLFTGLNIYYIILMIIDIFSVGIISILTVRERYDFKYKLIVILTIISMIINPTLGIAFILLLPNNFFARILSIVIANSLFGTIALFIILKREKKTINLEHWKYALKLDLPLIPHYISMILLGSSDKIMIGKICGNSYAAFYSIAYNASMVMTIFINSINTSFNPWIYKKLEKKEYSSITKLTNLLVIFVGCISILPMFFGPEIIKILGDAEYAEASYIMSIISINVFITYLYSLFVSIELYYEKNILVTYGSIMATIINIILNLIFINLYGYIAAGYTTLISYILLSLFHFYNVKKIMKKNNIDKIYNFSIICIIALFVIALGILIQFLYKCVVIRYILFLIIILFIIIFRKKIIYMFKKIKEK